MMPCMDVMATTTTATDCVWSFPGAAGAPEEGLASEEHPEADTDPRPDGPSTGSLCQVNGTERQVKARQSIDVAQHKQNRALTANL